MMEFPESVVGSEKSGDFVESMKLRWKNNRDETKMIGLS